MKKKPTQKRNKRPTLQQQLEDQRNLTQRLIGQMFCLSNEKQDKPTPNGMTLWRAGYSIGWLTYVERVGTIHEEEEQPSILMVREDQSAFEPFTPPRSYEGPGCLYLRPQGTRGMVPFPGTVLEIIDHRCHGCDSLGGFIIHPSDSGFPTLWELFDSDDEEQQVILSNRKSILEFIDGLVPKTKTDDHVL